MTDKEKLLAEIDKCLKETSRSKELVTAFIENVEEDKVQDSTRLHVTEETFNVNEDKDWHLKDVLFVPVEGRTALFRVEHISEDKVYFVAVDAVGKSTMEGMNQFLDDYLSKMPKSLVKRMSEIEHKVNGKIVRKNKLTLLSYANVVRDTDNYKLDGADDILFDGLRTETKRCKNNKNGEIVWYWLDTPSDDSSAYFITVYIYGWPVNGIGVKHTLAVVPCFSLKRKRISND